MVSKCIAKVARYYNTLTMLNNIIYNSTDTVYQLNENY